MHPGRRWTVALTAIFAAAVVAGPAVAPAQGRPAQSSADTVRLTADVFFRAVADERWQAAAAMTDTTLMRFVVAQRLRWQPQIASRGREHATLSGGDALSYEFAGIQSLPDLAKLSSLEATARYLQAQDARVQLREAARRAGCPDSDARAPASLRRIVGVALPSDTVAFVLHEVQAPRDESDGLPRLEPMVMQLRLRDRRWTIIPGSALLRSPGSLGAPLPCDSPRRPSP
jgi:hypothetical protein